MRCKIDQTDKMRWLMVELKTKLSRVLSSYMINFQLTSSHDPKPIRDLWPQTQGRQTELCIGRCPLLRLRLQPELCLYASPVNHLQPAAVSRQTAKPISVCDTRPQSFSTTLQTFRDRARTTTTKAKACR